MLILYIRIIELEQCSKEKESGGWFLKKEKEAKLEVRGDGGLSATVRT